MTKKHDPSLGQTDPGTPPVPPAPQFSPAQEAELQQFGLNPAALDWGKIGSLLRLLATILESISGGARTP